MSINLVYGNFKLKDETVHEQLTQLETVYKELAEIRREMIDEIEGWDGRLPTVKALRDGCLQGFDTALKAAGILDAVERRMPLGY